MSFLVTLILCIYCDDSSELVKQRLSPLCVTDGQRRLGQNLNTVVSSHSVENAQILAVSHIFLPPTEPVRLFMCLIYDDWVLNILYSLIAEGRSLF